MHQRNPYRHFGRQRQPMQRPWREQQPSRRRNLWTEDQIERMEAIKAEQARVEAERAEARAKLEAERAESQAKLEAERAEAQAKLEAQRAEAQAKLEAEQRAEAERKAKAEREERLRQARIKACENWEKSLTDYIGELQPLKLRPEVHRRNHHFDIYTVFVQLPSDLSVRDLNVRVQGPTLTLSAERPITVPKHLQGYDFCEPEHEIPKSQTWDRTWEFESPLEAEEVQAEMVPGHKLKLQFPNPPEHEVFNIPIRTIEDKGVFSTAVKTIQT